MHQNAKNGFLPGPRKYLAHIFLRLPRTRALPCNRPNAHVWTSIIQPYTNTTFVRGQTARRDESSLHIMHAANVSLIITLKPQYQVSSQATMLIIADIVLGKLQTSKITRKK